MRKMRAHNRGGEGNFLGLASILAINHRRGCLLYVPYIVEWSRMTLLWKKLSRNHDRRPYQARSRLSAYQFPALTCPHSLGPSKWSYPLMRIDRWRHNEWHRMGRGLTLLGSSSSHPYSARFWAKRREGFQWIVNSEKLVVEEGKLNVPLQKPTKGFPWMNLVVHLFTTCNRTNDIVGRVCCALIVCGAWPGCYGEGLIAFLLFKIHFHWLVSWSLMCLPFQHLTISFPILYTV